MKRELVAVSTPLTQAQTAEIVGVSPRTVARWARGTQPQPAHLTRLMELRYVLNEAAITYAPDGVPLWLFAPNRALNHATPAELIRAGEYRRVVGLLAALAEGVTA